MESFKKFYLWSEIQISSQPKSNKNLNFVDLVVKDIVVAARGLGFNFRPVKSGSDAVVHHCDVSSELCCPDGKPRRWAPPLVARFGVIARL